MGTLEEYGGYLHDSVVQRYTVDIEKKVLTMELLLEPAPAMGREEEYHIILRFDGVLALQLDNGGTYNILFELIEYTPEAFQAERTDFLAEHPMFSLENIRKNGGHIYELCATIGLDGYIAAQDIKIDIRKQERLK